ncbi:LxmA leader domain family RiPP [Nocardiopsis ganjiahuensis]|uniref:LxmA leader domain family RiPP n=1 Tax=Nocardiopsis ganjiahuensis TaxID=239984 RepID=UPI0003486062|nr:LxmA leader domain family RiPP [Nocardiopsis ganjiahuensis]
MSTETLMNGADNYTDPAEITKDQDVEEPGVVVTTVVPGPITITIPPISVTATVRIGC